MDDKVILVGDTPVLLRLERVGDRARITGCGQWPRDTVQALRMAVFALGGKKGRLVGLGRRVAAVDAAWGPATMRQWAAFGE